MSPVWLFAYGSLVSGESAARTLGHRLAPHRGPLPATLTGYRRTWNVGSDATSHPERVLTAPDGAPFAGTLAVLGLVAAPDAACNGALYRLDRADLDRLAVRERNYALLAVHGCVTAAAPDARGPLVTAERVPWPGPVVTYTPRPEALRRLAAARKAGSAAVQRTYARGVALAFEALGPGELTGYRRTTRPHGLPEVDIDAR